MTTRDPDDTAPGDEVSPDTKSGGPTVSPKGGGTGRVGPERREACAGTGDTEEAVGGG
jgi:hypothetical protein